MRSEQVQILYAHSHPQLVRLRAAEKERISLIFV